MGPAWPARSTSGRRRVPGPEHVPPRPGSENARRAKPARRPPRLASLQLKRVDPWTVLKISLIVSIVMFFVWMIATGILYYTLGAMDVWSRVNDTFSTLTSTPDVAAGQTDLITAPRVFVRHRDRRGDQHRAVHRAGDGGRVHLQRGGRDVRWGRVDSWGTRLTFFAVLAPPGFRCRRGFSLFWGGRDQGQDSGLATTTGHSHCRISALLVEPSSRLL